MINISKKVYNNFQTPEKWDNVNKHNKELIKDYELELKARALSEKTIEQYKNDLKIFACYTHDELENKPFYKVTKKEIRNFVIDLQEKNVSPARINRLLSAIRTMLDYATEDDDYEDQYATNVASKIKGLKKDSVREIVFLTRKEVDTLYDILVSKKRYQEALLLALLIDTAARKNEIFQIKKSSITKKGKLTNKVTGKGNKRFSLSYNMLTKKTFPLYLEQRGEDDKDFLWYKKDTVNGIVELTPHRFYSWIKSWNKLLEKETGIHKNFNIHSFRHTALELLSTGEHYICELMGVKKFELSDLQILANHNDISITNSYLKDKTEDELVNKFHVEDDEDGDDEW
ncbi:tyrosine-type recombinase/integrase [Peptostreptococcus faecalis]|uniref:tyrosine-type recombinase/integrase n=1 Tax=Peptostreptococcus faecalis TaxID=2045015 RepID=UPI001A9A5D4A|nr:tyrosine-type recombinase/integrase [Peptostreptococcus faecalis]